MKNKAPVKLRMHHFICVLGFRGKGYSPKFVSEFWNTLERLGEKNAYVQAVDGADDICAPCPQNDNGLCRTPEKIDEPRIRSLDLAYQRSLNIASGETMLWKDAKRRISDQISDEVFEENCAPCAWKKLGYCKSALQKLRNSALTLCLGVFIFTSAYADTVEEVKAKLLKNKTSLSSVFLKIQQSIDKENYSKALKELSALESNTEFADYYNYLSGVAQFSRIQNFEKASKWDSIAFAAEKAFNHFQQVSIKNPYTPFKLASEVFMGRSEVYLAAAYLKIKKNKKALDSFQNGFQRLSDRNRLLFVPKSIAQDFADLCKKQKSKDLCGGWAVQLTNLFPKNKIPKTLLTFKEESKTASIEKTSSTRYRVEPDLQAFEQAFQLYLEKKYSESYSLLEKILEDYPLTTIKLRTKFWMARNSQKLEKDARAEKIYREIIRDLPFSYYALLSSWFSGVSIHEAIDVDLPDASQGYDQRVKFLSPNELYHLSRAETLIANGAAQLARYELEEIKPNSKMPNEFVVYLALLNDLSQYHLGVSSMSSELSSRNYRGHFSTFGGRLMFPLYYLKDAQSAVRKYNVEPLLILSVMKQESAFNPQAVSSSNAYGMMQIIAPTAFDLDAKLEIFELFHPEKSMGLGAQYIEQLLKLYSGNIVYALAAYNAGPGHSTRWKKTAPANLEIEEYIELIGFRETHDYVQNILRNFYWYTQRVKGIDCVNLQDLVQKASLIKR